MRKTHHIVNCDVQKWRSDHCWKLGCRKIARRCRLSKSKCSKHTMFGPLLEVGMLKNCTALCREAYFQVKMFKTHHSRTTLGSWDMEKLHAAVARSAFASQNAKKLRCQSCDVKKLHVAVPRCTFQSQNAQNASDLEQFWRFRCRKGVRQKREIGWYSASQLVS